MNHFKSSNFFLNIKNKNTFNSILFNIVMYRNKLKKNNWLLSIYYILKGYDLFF